MTANKGPVRVEYIESFLAGRLDEIPLESLALVREYCLNNGIREEDLGAVEADHSDEDGEGE